MTTPPQYAPPPGYPGYGYIPEPTTPRGEPLARFEHRLLAFLIDGLIVGLVTAALVVPITFAALFRFIDNLDVYDTTDGQQPPDVPPSVVLEFLAFIGIAVLIALVLGYVYQVEVALRGDGATPGKRVMKLRIVPLNPAEVLTRRHLVIRWLAAFGLNLVSLSWLDGLWQLWDKPYRQCLHDKAAQTAVARLNA